MVVNNENHSAELVSDTSIDPGQLDVEAVKQAETFFKYAERYARQKAKTERMEAMLKRTEARLQLDARNHPDKYGITNVTEAAVKSAVVCSPVFEKAGAEYYAALEQTLVMEMAVKAMDQKKRMLEILTTLHGQEYFAGPSVPRNLVAAWVAHNERRGVEVSGRQLAVARRRGEPRGPRRVTPEEEGGE